MAVKLRLVRMGKKKQPTYRVVAADSRSPRNGRFIEIIGSYEPRQDPSVIRIDNERPLHWLRHGAQPTERVEKLLRISGVQKVSGSWAEHEGVPAPPTEPAPDTAAASSAEAAKTQHETPQPEAPETEAPEPVASETASETAQAADGADKESEQ